MTQPATPPAKFVGPLANLTPAAKKRLEGIIVEIEATSITVGFTLATDFGKRKSFVSLSASRGGGGSLDEPARLPGWAVSDVKPVTLVLAKQVVARCYECAAAEGVMPSDQAREEQTQILIALDKQLADALNRDR